MRGSRGPASHDNPASAGNKLREALARKTAGDETRAQEEQAHAQDALRQSISKWFNDVASALPPVVLGLTEALEQGRNVATDRSFAPPEDVPVRGVTGLDLGSLDGFKSLDQACRDLDIECTVTVGRYGYGRTSTAGQEYLHLNIDAAKPYKPLAVEKPVPHGSRRF